MKRITILFLMILSFYYSVMGQDRETPKTDLSFFNKVLSEKIYFVEKQIEIDTLAWNPHPAFKGVFLKHLSSGKDTKGQISCHIVKIEAFCTLDTHLHDGKLEIHEVIGGDGTMHLRDKEIPYSTGCVCIIPANTPLKVVAGKNGICSPNSLLLCKS